ncbi:hypothetical protein BJ741DRAFT_624708 [Chytriomyces cf. hyalinus JEL632]|nr:hypothetical protein BJ741DRAFT_624708 [Chytriomyces cf. hyalinus JEL632]
MIRPFLHRAFSRPLIQLTHARWASSDSAISATPAVTGKPKGRRPRSVRDTPPNPLEQERQLLSEHLARTRQSAMARSSQDTAENNQHSFRPKLRKLNHTKLSLLSGSDKIELLRQLLAGGQPYLRDTEALYNLISRNGIMDRLKFIDFHNLFRLLAGRSECMEHRHFLLRVWRDWGRFNLNGPDGANHVYSTASYARMIKVASVWGDRLLAKELWDQVVEQDIQLSLGIESYHDLISLFSEPIHVLQDIASPDDASLETSTANFSKKTALTPPTQEDLLVARTILDSLDLAGAPPKTAKTHECALSLAAQDVAKPLDRLTSAHDQALTYIEFETAGLIERSHVALRLNNQSIRAFSAAGFPKHAYAIVKALTQTVLPFVEPVFNGPPVKKNPTVSVETLRKDSTRLLTTSLRTLGDVAKPDTGAADGPVAVAEQLVKSLNGVVGCVMDESCVGYLVRLHGRSGDFKAAEDWAVKGEQWFNVREVIKVRTSLMGAYAEALAEDGALRSVCLAATGGDVTFTSVRQKVLNLASLVADDAAAKRMRSFDVYTLQALDLLEEVRTTRGYVVDDESALQELHVRKTIKA